MDSLEKNNVYDKVLGRTFGDDDGPAPDIISEGFDALNWGPKSPLHKFNRMINILQRRCSVQPLVDTALPRQTQEGGGNLSSSHILNMLSSRSLVLSEDDGTFTGNNLDRNEYELDEELQRALEETQILSLETAEDVDLEMDADLQAQVETFDGGDETDNSDDGEELFV